ncbi:MAG: Gfo/Idh/MocA family oxidoreductase [Candidatus Omnitrophica bacterium]|nr:Gfo/Idh/MocA family oxidoreductase [Candidatus Omnitrophota bacterium]
MAHSLALGLIGTGRWGQVYLRTLAQLQARCKLTVVCARHAEQAAQVPSSAGVVQQWEEVVHGPCEAVIIATPPATHAEIVMACLEAGKPSIVEKPLCLDVETAERLHRAAQRTQTPVLVDHTHLFSSAYRILKHHLSRADDPIRVILSEGMALGPFRSHTPALWDWAVHDVAICLDLLGNFPQRIDALGGPPDPDGRPDAVSLLLEFAQGAAAWIQAGRLESKKRRSLSVMTEHHLYLLESLSAETLTVADIDFSARYRQGIPEAPQWRAIRVEPSPPLQNMLLYFLDGLAGGDRSRFGTALAVETVRVLAACEQAMQQRTAKPTLTNRE